MHKIKYVKVIPHFSKYVVTTTGAATNSRNEYLIQIGSLRILMNSR